MQRAYESLRDRGFEVVGFAMDTNPEGPRRVAQNAGATWPQLFDGRGWEGTLIRTIGVNNVPATFLFDREGRVRRVSLRGEELEAAVRALLDEPVRPPAPDGAGRQ